MQKKKNTRFRVVDFLIILICFAGSTLSGAAFWNEYNRTFTKLNEEPVGTIIFRKRTAQRKFIDRVVWDRLKQASLIYNGDTIRTIEFSEVFLTFKNEQTHISLSENTMIQVFYNDIDGARIEFSGGNLEIISGDGNVVITAGSSQIAVNGQIDLKMNEDGFSLSVIEGNAVLNGETIESGNIAAMTPAGEPNKNPAIIMKSFGTSARILNSSLEEAVPVEFSWLTVNFTPDTYTIIEVSLNKNFDHIIQKQEITNSLSAFISLENGNYWWRVYPADSGSGGTPVNNIYPSGTIEVIDTNTFSGSLPDILPVKLVANEPNRLRGDSQPEPEPVIAVTSPPVSISPLIPAPPTPQPARQPELARQPEPPLPQIAAAPDRLRGDSQPVPEPSVPAPPPQAPRIEEPEPQPAPPKDTAEQLREISGSGAITNIFPPDNYVIYTEQLNNTPSLRFSWEGKANEYDFALYRANGEVIIPKTAVTGQVFILSNPKVLQEGEYIWHIYERIRRREDTELPGAVTRLIVRNEPMERKPLPTVDPGELYGN